MQQDRWRQVKTLFQAALDQPTADRETFLAGRCDDGAMRGEVMRLLRLHDGSADFLRPPVDPTDNTPQVGVDPLIDRRIDGFRILHRIGAGGMGAVYEAEQERPRRRAAVKVLRAGFATRAMLRRFEYESEILAKLHHPGIAHVYASGTFDLGDGPQPWFAMELVDGHTLHAYAREQRPSTLQKIELLLRICDAVQHAHQRGIVHRDLKPANILVVDEATKRRSDEATKGRNSGLRTQDSGLSGRDSALSTQHSALGAQPKILDFGVARVLDADVQATMHTAVGELVGTFNYMSPEQVSGDPNDVDARCDVYALGVIGYELLAGRLPHQRKSGAVAEVLRAIERDDPKRLGAIDPAFRGDLEIVFAKALEKDPADRYQSAAELAADLRRVLRDEPITARPPGAWYQFRKFARRNRAVVATVMAAFVLLTAAAAISTWQAVRARTAERLAAQRLEDAQRAQTRAETGEADARREAARSKYEADKATAINNFMTNDFVMNLLAAANAGEPGQRLPVAELVDQAAEKVGVMFAERPLDEAAVRNEVGTVYYNLSAFDKAAAQFRRSLELWEANLGPDHADTLKAVNNLGQSVANLGQADEAEALYRRGLEGRLRVLGENDPYTLVSMHNLAILLRDKSKLDEAEPLLRRTLELQRRLQGATHKNTLITMLNLGTLLIVRDKLDEGLAMHRTAYETSRDTLGKDHVTTLIAGTRLAATLRRAKKYEEAERLLIEVCASSERTLGPNHNDTIIARRTLALIYKDQGNRAAAAEQLRLALAGISAQSQPSEKLVNQIKKDLDAVTRPPPSTATAPTTAATRPRSQ